MQPIYEWHKYYCISLNIKKKPKQVIDRQLIMRSRFMPLTFLTTLDITKVASAMSVMNWSVSQPVRKENVMLLCMTQIFFSFLSNKILACSRRNTKKNIGSLGQILRNQTKELQSTVKHTNLWITSVCIDISKQPIDPCSLQFMMAAASLKCSYDHITLKSSYNWSHPRKRAYLCPDRVAWLHSTLILNSPASSCDRVTRMLSDNFQNR
jgi:hypothetical protein